MNAITIENLTKIYPNSVQALKSVNLAISAGDFFGLMGANGAGKTTMIGIITGLVNKTSGRVKVFEHDPEVDPIRAKRMIGVVPQEFNFNVFEKVQDIIVTQAGYFGIDRKAALKDSEVLLKKLDIWDKRNVPSRALSGGMKRRLMIARGLIHHPKLLILDEPTAGVDVELRHGMWGYLKELNEQGTTIVLTTHYLEEVEQMCKNAAFIHSGEIIRVDSVRNLVQFWEKETFFVVVKEMKSLSGLARFSPRPVDETALKIELSKGDTLNDLLEEFSRAGMEVVDIRPQGHRLERLFLEILKK
jgi:ABC-2 type transport system ATP-binding protein